MTGEYDDILNDNTYSDILKAPRESTGKRIGRSMSGPMRGYITAMQGPALGFLDEISGGARGTAELLMTGDFGKAQEAYRHSRDVIRGMEAQQREEYPTLSNLSQLAAGMPVYVSAPVAKLPGLGTSVGGNMARAAINAVPLAAVQAVGASESDTIGGVSGDVGEGVLTSAATAASLPMVGAVGRGIWQAGAGKLAPKTATHIAEEKVAEQFLRDAPPGSVFTGQARNVRPGGVNPAGKRLPDIVETYGTSEPLRRMEARLGKLGPGATMADVGGRNVYNYLDMLAEQSGTTGTLVERAARDRLVERGKRLTNAADEVLGLGGWFGRKEIKSGVPREGVSLAIRKGEQFAQSIDDLTNAALENSRPYYQALETVRVPIDDELTNIMQSAQGNMARAERIIGYEGRFGDSLRQAMKQGGDVRIMDLENIKRALYDASSELKRKGAGNESRAVEMLRQRLVAKLENASPVVDTATGQKSLYRLANDEYAGPSQLADAMELGRKALSPDKTGEIAANVARLTKGEREAYRIGVVQAVKELAGEPGGQARLLNFFRSPNMQDRLKLAFGNDYKAFAAKLLREEQLAKIGKVGGGSKTFSRFMHAEDLGEEAMQDVAQMASNAKAGNTVGMFGAALRLYNRLDTPEPVRNEIGRILMLKGAAAQQKMGELAATMARIQQNRMQQAAAMGVGSAAVSPIIYRSQTGE